MEPAAHEIINQILMLCDAREDTADQLRLVFRSDLLVSERRGEPMLRLVHRIGHGAMRPPDPPGEIQSAL